MKLSGKMLVFFVPLIAISLLISVFITYKKSSSCLLETEALKLLSLVKRTDIALEIYFDSIDDFLYSFSKDPTIIKKLKEFKEAFHEIEEKYGNAADILQKAYIDDNPYPIGEKQKLFALKGKYAQMLECYDRPHQQLHPFTDAIIKSFGFYDIFLVGIDGDIVYTYFKERDFATNLSHGRWKDTNIADLYRLLKKKRDDNIWYVDFEPYAPSHNVPAAFAGTVVRDSNKKVIGFLIVQLPIDRINAIMQDRVGLGKTGETYVVGKDFLMRSDSRFSKESTILRRKVETPQVKKAIVEKKEGWMISFDYRNVKVLSAYSPFKHNGLDWAVIGEVDYAEVMEPVYNLLKINIIVLIVVLLVAVALVFVFVKRLVKPIVLVSNALRQIANGDLTVSVSVSGKDEIALMAEELNKMVYNLRKLVSNVSSSTVEVGESSSKLMEVAENQSAQAEEISAQANSINDSINNISAAVEEVTSGIQEVASTAQTVSHSTQELSKDAESASSAAESGQKMLQEIVEKMNSVTAEVERSANITREVAKKAESIGDIVDTISSIAEQTNLLALNAAIEAARAGEAGRGFAVVAEEIRNLAEESRASTEKIAQILKEIGEEANKAKLSMESTVELVSVANKQVNVTHDQFRHIIRQIENVLSKIENIAESVEEQSAAVEEMASAMDNASKMVAEVVEEIKEINKVIDMQAQQAIEVSELSKKLASLSENLKQQVRVFKI